MLEVELSISMENPCRKGKHNFIVNTGDVLGRNCEE